jgi:hypothetical protein
MVMLGNKKIEMMHFPSRLNVSFCSVDFKEYPTDEKPYFVGLEYLENILDNSIIMTGKYCSQYANQVGTDKQILKLIEDEWGDFKEEKELKLKPNYSLEYKDLRHSKTLSYSVTIKFPKTSIKSNLQSFRKTTLEDISDLILKAGIKSISSQSESIFELTLIKVNTNFNSFYKQNYSPIPEIRNEDFKELYSEIKEYQNNGLFFLHFYSDKWDSHFSNFNYNE